MSEKLISLKEAQEDILACAAYLAERIGGSDDRSEAIAAVLPVYLERKNVDLAAELANSVDDPFVGDKLLIQVAAKCAEIDDVDYALQLSEVIEEYGLQSQAREAIALALAGQGKFDAAFDIAGQVLHPDQAFAAIAVKQAENGDTVSAIETISKIDYPASAVIALIAIAGVEIDSGNYDAASAHLTAANEKVSGIELEEEKIKAICDIGNSFIAAEKNEDAILCFKTALDLAEKLDSIHKDSLLSFVSAGFMNAGSVELADNSLDLIIDKTQIASTLLAFSRYYQAKDETEDAKETLGEAYDVLKSQHEKETRSSKAKFDLFGSIAAQYAVIGNSEKALDIALGIESEDDSANTLAYIAQIFVKNGDIHAAESAVMNIPEPSGKMFAHIGMGNTAKQVDDKASANKYYLQAIEIAEEVSRAALVSAAYKAVSTRLYEMDEIQKAREIASAGLATINSIRGETAKVIALSAFASLYDQAGFELSESDKRELDPLRYNDQ